MLKRFLNWLGSPFGPEAGMPRITWFALAAGIGLLIFFAVRAAI